MRTREHGYHHHAETMAMDRPCTCHQEEDRSVPKTALHWTLEGRRTRGKAKILNGAQRWRALFSGPQLELHPKPGSCGGPSFLPCVPVSIMGSEVKRILITSAWKLNLRVKNCSIGELWYDFQYCARRKLQGKSRNNLRMFTGIYLALSRQKNKNA